MRANAGRARVSTALRKRGGVKRVHLVAALHAKAHMQADTGARGSGIVLLEYPELRWESQ